MAEIYRAPHNLQINASGVSCGTRANFGGGLQCPIFSSCPAPEISCSASAGHARRAPANRRIRRFQSIIIEKRGEVRGAYHGRCTMRNAAEKAPKFVMKCGLGVLPCAALGGEATYRKASHYVAAGGARQIVSEA